MSTGFRFSEHPTSQYNNIGFRIASLEFTAVPEPSSLLGAAIFWMKFEYNGSKVRRRWHLEIYDVS